MRLILSTIALGTILLSQPAAAKIRTGAPDIRPRRAVSKLPLGPDHFALKAEQTAQSDALREAEARGVLVVGGGNAVRGDWPFMAALVSSGIADNWNGQFCGGSLIHSYWILTAAHCVDTSLPGDLEVVLGAHDLRNDVNVQRIAVEEIWVHPHWNPITSDNDVALLRLSQPAHPQYTPVAIVDASEQAAPGAVATVIGWGNTSGSGNVFPDILQAAQVPIVSNSVANLPQSYNGGITSNMLAAGFSAGGIDSCQGDSGGPLLVPAANGVGWAQIGVVSWGNGCAQPDYYGIYTHVLNFRPDVYGQFRPAYGAWEEREGVAGEGRDSNADGIPHFLEFACHAQADEPNAATNLPRAAQALVGPTSYPALTFNRPRDASGDVAYHLAIAPGVTGAWQRLPIAPLITSQTPLPADAGGEKLVVRHPLPLADIPAATFMKMEAVPATNLNTGPRRLAFGQFARLPLTNDDPIPSTAPFSYAKSFRLVGTPPGANVHAVLRSRDFNARLELRDADTDALIALSSGNAGGGTDEKLIFPAHAGTNYLLKAMASTSNQLGMFTLAAYQPNFALPTHTAATTNNGTLANTDPIDPNFLPMQYYYDDYRFTDPAAPRDIVFTMRHTNGTYYAYTMLLNEETREIMSDNYMGSDRTAIRFQTRPGVPYLLRASTGGTLQTGNYALGTFAPRPPVLLNVPGNVSGDLGTSDPPDPRFATVYRYDAYTLTGLVPGSRVQVGMTASGFSAWLVLVRVDTGAVLYDNPAANPTFTVTIPSTGTFQLWATSGGANATGTYTLFTSIVP